jgi:short-subunit dehydrogenase
VGYWENKVALVTGGSAGLGLAIAKAFAAAGANVAIAGRDSERLKDALQQLYAAVPDPVPKSPVHFYAPIAADVTRQSDVERMMSETLTAFGTLDVLVNCAGQSTRGEVLTTPPEEFARLLESNFLSLVRCTQAAAPHLIASRGHVVNIGSLAGKSTSRYLGAYPASKFAVSAFSQQLRWELGPKGVHTLLVCTGPIQRDDAGQRYDEQAAQLPEVARQPGGGVRIKGIAPAKLAAMILRACERRKAELVVPWRAKVIVAISQLWPELGDWLVRRLSS